MRKDFHVLFVSTTNVGVSQWRLWQFASVLNKMPGVKAYCFVQDYKWYEGYGLWEITGQKAFEARQSGNPVGDKVLGKDIRKGLDRLWGAMDMVVCQYVHYPFGLAFIECMKDRHKKTKIFMEIDDYVFEPPPWAVFARSYQPGGDLEKLTAEQAKLSDGVVTTTDTLKRAMSRYNKNVHIMENSLDWPKWDEAYALAKRLRGQTKKTIIGFAGGAGHVQDLDMVSPAIQKVLKGRSGVFFHFVNARPTKYKGVHHFKHLHKWIPTHQFHLGLAKERFKIGISPLLEHVFNDAKSNLKFLEFSGLGIPCVASPSADFRKHVKHGETGYLAKTHDDWVEYLTLLVENPDIRERVGEAAWEYVRGKFNLEKTARRYLRMLKGKE